MTHEPISSIRGNKLGTSTAGEKLVAAMSQAVNETKAKKKVQIDRHIRMVEKNRSYDLVQWLRQSETKNGAAHTLMRSLHRAEQTCGHPLCIAISEKLVLSSKGFRLIALEAPEEIGIFKIGTNVKRVTKRRIDRRLTPDFCHEEIKRDVNNALAAEDVSWRILYLGVDEWPKIGRVTFAVLSAATVTVSSAFFAIPFYFTHRQEYALAFTPALVQPAVG